MKTKINNDQKSDGVHASDFEKDLQAELKTKLGDGDLYEDNGVYYYKPVDQKKLYEVDFDAFQETGDAMLGAARMPMATSSPDLKKDFTTNDEVSDSNDPRERTDSVEGSCPLNNKNKKQKSATNMKKIEKTADTYSEESDKKKSMVDEEDEKETKDTVKEPETGEVKEVKEDMKEDAKPMPPKPDIQELKILIKDLVKESVEDLTKDIREERNNIIQKKTRELTDLLQEEPYGFTAEDLEGQSVKDLEKMKSIVERSKVFKDFQDAQKQIEDPMEINKEIFEAQDFQNASAGLDPWRSFKTERGF